MQVQVLMGRDGVFWEAARQRMRDLSMLMVYWKVSSMCCCFVDVNGDSGVSHAQDMPSNVGRPGERACLEGILSGMVIINHS